MEEKRRYTARELAVLSLCRLERQGKYGSLEADAAIKKFKLSGAEKALYTKLFYGVLERRITLDHTSLLNKVFMPLYCTYRIISSF